MRRLAAAAALAAPMLWGVAAAADSLALWRIVNDQCVPQMAEGRLAPPCQEVDGADGVVVIKDRVGAVQMLAIPTSRVTGIEDPVLLSPGLPGLWPAAWRARRLAEQRLGRPLPRDWVGLAINSKMGRSQDQLHIHIDCLQPELREALARHRTEIGSAFTSPGITAGGHDYRVRRLDGEDLDGQDPIRLVAAEIPGAAVDIGRHTVAVVGAVFADGKPGFYLLDDEAAPLRGDFGHAEELLDHSCAGVPTG